MQIPSERVADLAQPPRAPSLSEALRFWLKLGCISFGGPAGQIALMHRELVQERRWISERRFLHALNYCMLLPGPEAQQLTTYLGWLLHRTWGGVAAGALFVLPSLLLLIGLSWGYVVFGQQPWVAALLYGIKPAVAALVLQAVHRLGGRVLKTPSQAPLLWAVALLSFVAVAWLRLPFPAVVLAAALVGWWGRRWAPREFAPAPGPGHPAEGATTHRAPAVIDDATPVPAHARFAPARFARVLLVGAMLWLLPMAGLLAWQGLQGTLAQMGWFFTKAALLTFGGAYAVLPYVYQGAVEQFGWLSGPQMMDGLALGETTPGPLIMVVAYVGFLGGWARQVLGPDALFLGAALAAGVVTWFTFLPSFVFILAGGPLVESTHGQLRFTAPLTAIIAHIAYPARAGGQLSSELDGWALAVMALAAWALLHLRWGVVTVLAAAALLGLGLRLTGWA